ncbi:MAG: YihY/virulence factor BrkB family protein [Mycoplasmatota bacterium]|nr:YihY/virulence factor BrkB family protein [Mycoplasmatota bacterium]
MEQARGFFKKILELIKKPELRILPGQLAFFLVLSLVPLVALVGTLASFLSIPNGAIREVLVDVAPKEVTEIIINVISGQGMEISFNMIVFLTIAFILASNGTHSMIITSNEIYKIEPNSILKRRLKAILMGFILVMLFFFLLLIPIWGDIILQIISTAVNNTTMDIIYSLFKLVQYPIILTILYFGIKTIYIIAPDKKIESITATKGAIFTTIGWILSSEIYSIYIERFSNYDLFYGSISNVVILLLWVYILSYIFVLGMILNAGNYKESEEKKIQLKKEKEERERLLAETKALTKVKNDEN